MNMIKKSKKSVLYEKHIELTDKSRLADFAGYLMPLWYSSIALEHRAVREAVGLFDCTHMGVRQVEGAESAAFVDALCTNRAGTLAVGSAQYSYILDEKGDVLDDIIVYRRGPEKFMLVVNAANNEKVGAWLGAAPEMLRGYNVEVAAKLRDLQDLSNTGHCLVDVAIQGPGSCEVLLRVIDDEGDKKRVQSLKPFRFIETTVDGFEIIISRTGYTGARVGFELFVHPDQAGRLWEGLLGAGKPFGLEPCGLGARDSLRIEAGLPLYGHELAGLYNISPFVAGYGWAVKLEKDFFIGRDAMLSESRQYRMEVQRLEFPGRGGVRPIRPGDAVLNSDGRCLGWILSCAKVGEQQIALAYLERRGVESGDSIGIYYTARNARHIQQGRKEKVNKDEIVAGDVGGKVVERMARF